MFDEIVFSFQRDIGRITVKGSLNGSLKSENKRNLKKSGRVHETNLSRNKQKNDRLATYVQRFRSLVARDIDLIQ